MIAPRSRFWLCVTLALWSAVAYSQNDRILSTRTQPAAPPPIAPIPPAASVLNYRATLLSPQYQGVRLHIELIGWNTQNEPNEGEMGTPARQNNLFIILHYRYTNTSGRPLNPQVHRPRLFLADAAGQKFAPNRRASQDYRYAHDLDTVGPDKINPGVSVSDVAVFEVSPALFQADRWSIVVQEGQVIRIPLSVIPKKTAVPAE